MEAGVPLCVEVLKLLLSADLRGCGAPELSVTGRRGGLGACLGINQAANTFRNRQTPKTRPRAVKHCYQMFCN